MRGSPKGEGLFFWLRGERQHFVIYNMRDISYMDH